MAAGREAHRFDIGRCARLEGDHVHLLDLLGLAEVQLQGRTAVVERVPDRLRTVEVPERAVPDRDGEGLCRDGVLLDQVGRTFATSGLAAEYEGVGREQVHGVGAERLAQSFDQQA